MAQNKKTLLTILILLFTFSFGFSANNISLIENSKKSGTTVYYDSLSQSGMLEKNGHQLK